MNKAVFLDRDGVINECMTDRVKHVNKPSDLFLIPGVSEGISLLREAGYMIFIVTNQGGVGLRFLKEETLQRIHERLQKDMLKGYPEAKIDDIAYCPHKPKEGCGCRNPMPGMLISLAEKHGVDLGASFMCGDQETDVEAGKSAGTMTVKIGEDSSAADIEAPSLLAAVPKMLKYAEMTI